MSDGNFEWIWEFPGYSVPPLYAMDTNELFSFMEEQQPEEGGDSGELEDAGDEVKVDFFEHGSRPDRLVQGVWVRRRIDFVVQAAVEADGPVCGEWQLGGQCAEAEREQDRWEW